MNRSLKFALALILVVLVMSVQMNNLVQAGAGSDQKRAVTTTLRLQILKQVPHAKAKDIVGFTDAEAVFTVLLDESGKKTVGVHCSLTGTATGLKSGRKFHFVSNGQLTLNKNAPSMRDVSLPCQGHLMLSGPSDEQGFLVVLNVSMNPSGKITAAEVRTVTAGAP